jgi:hypothetical protein
MNLQLCNRLMPHDQDTGGFCIALLSKRRDFGGGLGLDQDGSVSAAGQAEDRKNKGNNNPSFFKNSGNPWNSKDDDKGGKKKKKAKPGKKAGGDGGGGGGGSQAKKTDNDTMKAMLDTPTSTGETAATMIRAEGTGVGRQLAQQLGLPAVLVKRMWWYRDKPEAVYLCPPGIVSFAANVVRFSQPVFIFDVNRRYQPCELACVNDAELRHFINSKV